MAQPCFLRARRRAAAAGLQGKDDEQFESAFWELYLHEAYLRSGYGLTIHPEVAGTSRHPDFLVEGNGARFYLEAVRACASAASVGEEKRLEDARRVLDTLGLDQYFLDMATYAIGTWTAAGQATSA
jgi:hypothetical protein